MNASQLVASSRKRRKGMALIMVISIVALMSILMVAIFSVTQTEYKSTQNYVNARTAKQLGDAAVAIVEAQIQNGQNTSTAASQRTIHSTQPGMVRVYSSLGNFVKGLKLYSSSQMEVTGTNEAVLYTSDHQVPTNWKTLRARYVDLNDPIVRPGLSGGSKAVYFPIIDPRAAYNELGSQTPSGTAATTQVEGFSYSKSTPSSGGSAPVTYNEVVLPTEAGGDSTKLRLPMPVEWLYVLQDGTTGALDTSNRFVSSSAGVQPSATNPIVGRMAFWTDDESCKVNINTASEPTFFAPPYFFHARDYQWANFPPASSEYQRYPGHPATVALSAILAPNLSLDPMAPGANVSNIVTLKEYIYGLIPKVAQGGSKSGTLPFMRDDFSASKGESSTAQIVDGASARSERLFASVDEMLFKEGVYGSSGREAASYPIPGGGGRILFDRNTLERSRFFLTAHSRAPEFSMHGLPRVAMWPVSDESLGQAKRTSFDNMIALCATLRGSSQGAAINNSYIFRRAQPHHPTHDVTGSSSTYGSSQGLQRNSKLLDYIYSEMTSLQFPRTSSLGGSTDYDGKYGQANAAQIALEMFDYIRTTNLYDGVLARENDGMSANNLSNSALYLQNDQIEGAKYTYTNQRVTRKASGSLNDGTRTQVGNDLLTDDASVLPGHGQVTPAVWQKNGLSLRGFGRMFTLSEVGFQFICTADGQNDDYAVNFNGQLSGGGSAPREDPTVFVNNSTSTVWNSKDPYTGLPARWYSNYPPLLPLPGAPPGSPPPMLYGVQPTPAGGPYHPSKHPGYDPNNWNMTLENGKPLAPDEKRIQALFLMETFCPSLGWTKFFPEYSIVLDGNFIAGIKLNGVSLFDTTQDIVVKSNGNLYESHDVYSLGGHAGPTAMAGNRGARPISGTGLVYMASDGTKPPPFGNSTQPPLFNTGNTAGHNALSNYGLQSNFVTVKRNQPMQLSFGKRELVVKIYDRHRYQELGLQPIQTVRIAFDASPLPVPALVYSPQRIVQDTRKGAPRGAELNHRALVDSYGRIIYFRPLQGPHWWCLNAEGCLGRLNGKVNPLYSGTGSQQFWLVSPQPYAYGANLTPLRQMLRGRLDTESRRADFPPGTAQGFSIFPLENQAAPIPIDRDTNRPWTGSDVVRTMVPAVGDYRLIAARYDVPSNMWMRHPLWTKTVGMGLSAPKNIHSFTGHWATTEQGVVLPSNSIVSNGSFAGLVTKNMQLGYQIPYDDIRLPDLPPDDGWAKAANSYGDFDNGIGNSRDGPWINKPDEGNFYAGNFTRSSQTKFYRSGYFWEPWHNSDDWRSGVYMTPNRIVSSPVMFGSLSTGVWPGGSTSSNALQGSGVSFSAGNPWQTLLFRPYTQSSAQGKSVSQGHPGDNNPRDHYLLDLFFMPVVEPYAISEPLSVAGRVNLNYQIMPFTNIRRATGMHAVLKGEFMTAIPANDDVNKSKEFKAATNATWSSGGDTYYSDTGDRKFWHRPINVTETLAQFDEKFNNTAGGANHYANNFRGLFRSASQICEIHLIPDTSGGTSVGGESLPSSTMKGFTAGNRQAAMDNFWRSHSSTGDNTRERPYSNIYSRVTTRSNTFRVHVRTQVIKKARSTDPAIFDPDKDAILGEYRGSTLIERYIDPTDTNNPLPDYGGSSNPLSLPPLETFYKFRTLETKRFSP